MFRRQWLAVQILARPDRLEQQFRAGNIRGVADRAGSLRRQAKERADIFDLIAGALHEPNARLPAAGTCNTCSRTDPRAWA